MTSADAPVSSEQSTPWTWRGLMVQPVVGPLLASRFCSIGCVIIGVSQVWSALAGAKLWQCPVPKYLGFECPGCGLSRASAELLTGNFPQMLRLHPFAPFFMIALAAFCVSAILPESGRIGFSQWVTRLERRLPLSPALLLLLVTHWIAHTLLHVI